MWKTSLTLLMILAIAITGLVFWQWKAYSREIVQETEVMETAEQEIFVKVLPDQLVITQIFIGLKENKEYELILPEIATEWKCIRSNGECERADQEALAFTAEQGQLTIEFKVSNHSLTTAQLYKNWMVQIQMLDIQSTRVEVSDYSRTNGTWIAGLPLLGRQNQDYVDFYVFKGAQSNPALYFDTEALYSVKNEKGITFYYRDSVEKKIPILSTVNKLSDFPPISVIFKEQSEVTLINSGILFANMIQGQSELESKLLSEYAKNKFVQLGETNSWVIDWLVSTLNSTEPKHPRSIEINNELGTALSRKDLIAITSEFIQGNHLSFEILDELISNKMGREVFLFSTNRDEQSRFIPLYYVDPRTVEVNQKNNKIHLIEYDGKKLLPVHETFSDLGFTVSTIIEEETVLLSNHANSYRFYLNQNIFILNEEDYGLLEKPLIELDGKIYMELKWIKAIFNVELSESEQAISLTL